MVRWTRRELKVLALPVLGLVFTLALGAYQNTEPVSGSNPSDESIHSWGSTMLSFSTILLVAWLAAEYIAEYSHKTPWQVVAVLSGCTCATQALAFLGMLLSSLECATCVFFGLCSAATLLLFIGHAVKWSSIRYTWPRFLETYICLWNIDEHTDRLSYYSFRRYRRVLACDAVRRAVASALYFAYIHRFERGSVEYDYLSCIAYLTLYETVWTAVQAYYALTVRMYRISSVLQRVNTALTIVDWAFALGAVPGLAGMATITAVFALLPLCWYHIVQQDVQDTFPLAPPIARYAIVKTPDDRGRWWRNVQALGMYLCTTLLSVVGALMMLLTPLRSRLLVLRLLLLSPAIAWGLVTLVGGDNPYSCMAPMLEALCQGESLRSELLVRLHSHSTTALLVHDLPAFIVAVTIFAENKFTLTQEATGATFTLIVLLIRSTMAVVAFADVSEISHKLKASIVAALTSGNVEEEDDDVGGDENDANDVRDVNDVRVDIDDEEEVKEEKTPEQSFECPFCIEEVPERMGLCLSDTCQHRMCGACARRHLETVLDAGKFPALCPQCAVEQQLPARRSEDHPPSDVHPCEVSSSALLKLVDLGQLEYQWANRFRKLQNQSHIPEPVLALCLRCQLPSRVARAEDGCVVCPYCTLKFCRRCEVRWHSNLTCDEHASYCRDTDATPTAAMAQHNDAASRALMMRIAKRCPTCQSPTIHYAGHACHHIKPGTGCPTCGTHWCYMCGAERVNNVQQCGCPLFCDNATTCGCPVCPECRPGAPCHQCDGGNNCPACHPR